MVKNVRQCLGASGKKTFYQLISNQFVSGAALWTNGRMFNIVRRLILQDGFQLACDNQTP
jgi:hypothetical protein